MEKKKMHTIEDVLEYVEREDVKFIRLAFFNVFGQQKNLSIMPGRLRKAFEKGVAFDAGSIEGFETTAGHDLLARPDPSTMSLLPWRSSENGVIHMISALHNPDGSLFEADPRLILKRALKKAWMAGVNPDFAAKFEFYLFELDNKGFETRIPLDQGGYMDLAPLDHGENVRREICLTMEEMGLDPHKSYHQSGPGQNEIDFHFADGLSAADDASIFKWIVRTTAHANGLFADFNPRPIPGRPGSGMHVQIRLRDLDLRQRESFMEGILRWLPEASLFCCRLEESYNRLGVHRTPRYADWSAQRNTFLRIPANSAGTIEVRLPDSIANPYLVFALILEAGIKGLQEKLVLRPCAEEETEKVLLPDSLQSAKAAAASSDFVREALPASVVTAYLES